MKETREVVMLAVVVWLSLISGEESVVAVEVPPPARPAGVPRDASVVAPFPTIRIYHWTSVDSDGRRRVQVFPAVDEWPEKSWGAEVVLTPIPFCCGAKRTSLKWRRSQPIRATTLAYLADGSQYQLSFEYQTSDCNCHPK
jgi:hypothetical protein